MMSTYKINSSRQKRLLRKNYLEFVNKNKAPQKSTAKNKTGKKPCTN